MNQALNIVLARPEIKTVYLAARWAYYSSGQGYGLDNTPSKTLFVNDRTGTAAVPELKRGLELTLQKLKAGGKQVVIIYGVPELNFDPAECLPANDFFTVRRIKAPCGVPFQAYFARQSSYLAWVTEILQRHPDVWVFDPSDSLCQRGVCHAKFGEHVYYSDSHHLNTAGSRYLMDRLQVLPASTKEQHLEIR